MTLPLKKAFFKKMNINKTNPDLEKERVSATLNLSQLKAFLGENLFGTREKHSQMMKFRNLKSFYQSISCQIKNKPL